MKNLTIFGQKSYNYYSLFKGPETPPLPPGSLSLRATIFSSRDRQMATPLDAVEPPEAVSPPENRPHKKQTSSAAR